MSAQGKFKCPICRNIKHINMAEVQDDAPVCENDMMDMMLIEVSS